MRRSAQMGIKMKICKIEDLKGNEVLARPVMTPDYNVLLSEGTVIKKEYISKLKDLGVTEIYIKEDFGIDVKTMKILKSDIEIQYKEKVKDILEHHTYHNNDELSELCKTADNIISNIIEEDEIVERIYDIRERSADIYEHSISVCTLSTLLSLKLGIDNDTVHDIGVGCLLHDVGLRYLTSCYSDRNIDEWKKEEAAEYKKHPIYAYTALRYEPWIAESSKNIILMHHERLDGSGYPLKSRDMIEEAKIVAVCDTFDEMICGIGCRRLKVYEAVEYLKSFKNVLFDGKIVDVFLEFTAVYPVGSRVITNEGEEAVVISQNKQFPERPVLRIIKDKNGNDTKEEIIKNMLKQTNLFITTVLE